MFGGFDDVEFIEVFEDLLCWCGGCEFCVFCEFGGYVDVVDGCEGDEDVDGDYDCYWVEYCFWDVGVGVDDFFVWLDDYFVVFEGDVCEVYCVDDVDEVVGCEWWIVEECCCLVWFVYCCEDVEGYEDIEDEYFDGCDDDVCFFCFFGFVVVDVGDCEYYYDCE